MEDSKLRKICLSVLLIIAILLTCFRILLTITILSTFCRKDTTQLAKDEFSKYFNGYDEVALETNDIIYLENTKLDVQTLLEDEALLINSVLAKKGRVLFATCVKNAKYDFTLNVYETNFLGTEIRLIFSKDGFKTGLMAYAIDDYLYIEHYLGGSKYNKESKRIDRYSVSENKYETIDSGENCSLSNYMHKEEPSRYSVEMIENISPQEHGKFIITDLDTGIVQTIDDEYLKNTIYIESMQRFNYGPKRVDISNGHILLTYGIGAGDGWTYPHLVFEYDFASNKLEYKLLVFVDDNLLVATRITYIG